MCVKMTSNEPSLFDDLLKEIDHVTEQYKSTEILSDEMVAYHNHRTGHQAYHSTGRAIAIQSLSAGLRKRYIGPTRADIPSSLDRSESAIVEFLEDNERCRAFNESNFPHNLDNFCQTVLGEAKLLLADALDSNTGSVLNLEAIAHGLRTGPGSSSGISQEASMYGRLCDGPMTFSSPDVASVYKACILTSRLTTVTEAIRLQLKGEEDSFNTFATFLSVPKTNLKNRGICTQPSGNMALQLSTHNVLAGSLRSHFGIDLESQQESNRTLAYIGSFGRKSMKNASWEFCTVDLSRASNFPWLLIMHIFPENWVEWLDLIRSHTMLVSDRPIVKSMCSSMGNGFTFALMTILLSSIIKVLYSLANLPEYDTHPIFGRQKTWAVYGDDIIVDKSVLFALKKVLSAFGFLYNDKKSCTEGFFRESCGADYYMGYSTRPVFVETLQTQADIYSLLNRLVLWGVYHSVDLKPALDVLRRALGKDVLRVPNWEDVCAGLHVPFSQSVQKPPYVPLVIREVLNVGNIPYRCSIAKPSVRILEREYVQKRFYCDIHTKAMLSYDYVYKTKNYAKNQPGMLLCILGGSVRMGQYGVRPLGPPRYKEVWKIAPGWGDPKLFDSIAVPLRRDAISSVYRLWEEYAVRNLSVKIPKLRTAAQALRAGYTD